MGTWMTGAAVLAHHGTGDHMWGNGWWWLWMPLVVLMWVAAIAVGAYLVIRAIQSPRAHSGSDRAREILAERYARGELTTQEYHERLEALR